MKSAVIRQTVLADLDDVTAVFDQYRQFQGKASDLNACRAFLGERLNLASRSSSWHSSMSSL
jgi:hypothetical protein